MAMEFHGLAVSEEEHGMIRFCGYETGQGDERCLVVCHVSHKTLASLAKDGHPTPNELMRVFQQHEALIHAAAAAKFSQGDTSPVITVRDILLRR
jgi:hypothetical protein